MLPYKVLLLPLLLLLPFAGPVQADPAHSPVLPDPTMTPGDVLTTDATAVCQPGYAKSVRNVPQSVKNQVYREYGVTSRQPHEYEIDHVVSLQLGGSNSIRNLWPQSFVTQPLNAYVKDKVE
ncbi:MAG TPA: HNH endonuclease signature motif containing protein, partial [Candidatus Competibacteraceae bacterium]|nr:HNH endonuclease signature motif containing protein [Candidatus Competibacteraceae bacterium]